jgi:branched-chain amino acid transport system permease protein
VQLFPSLSVLDNVRLRLSGLYLAMATLGFTLIVQEMMLQLAVITHGSEGMHVQPASLLELTFDTDYRKYYLVLVVTVAMLLVARNLVSERTTTSARRRGVNLARYTTIAFAVSALYTGLAGGLSAFIVRFQRRYAYRWFGIGVEPMIPRRLGH